MTTDKGPAMMNLFNSDGTIGASMLLASAGEAQTIAALLHLDGGQDKSICVNAKAGLVTMTVAGFTLVVRPTALVVLDTSMAPEDFQASLDAGWALAKAEDNATPEEG